MPINDSIKRFLSFNRAERYGLIVLFIILILLIITNIFLPRILLEKKANELDSFKNEIELFEKLQKKKSDSIEQAISTKSSRETFVNHLTPFSFNPNNLPEEKWLALGLNEKQIQIIKKYESRGGKFHKPEDLSKIYGISQAEFDVLRPFITIDIVEDKIDKKQNKLTPFEFDPNIIDKHGLMQLGLSENLSSTIINYRNKGGHFYNPDDFEKIYGMDSATFILLKPYIKIEEEIISGKKENNSNSLVLDLNNSDTLDLQQLTGIGPAFANRIVKYREMLGGYFQKEQLMEVFGMDSLRFAQIADHVMIANDPTQKININKASIKELIKHPYIEFYLAKSIVTQREKIGKFNSLDELLDTRLVYDDLFKKIKPYLTL